jgi:hypothetical protein
MSKDRVEKKKKEEASHPHNQVANFQSKEEQTKTKQTNQ